MRYSNKILRLLLVPVFALIFNANTVSAQSGFGFTPNGLSGWHDTAYASDSLVLAGLLMNYDNSITFSDSLEIHGYVDTGAAIVPFSIPVPTLQNWSLPPLDTSWIIFPVVLNPGSQGGQFHVGNNVVVVWPFTTTGTFEAIDSVTLNVFLIDTINSIGHEYPPPDVRIYPVPANGPLYINSYHPQYRVTGIVIRDALGQEIYRSAEPSGPINTNEWAPGLYTVETTLTNGSVSYYKILRQ